MTDQQINDAIAKVCGWEPFPRPENASLLWVPPGGGPLDVLPNYVGSLDAMHEAEEAVIWKKELAYRYDVELEKVLADNPYPWSATARQRAEAFLRTLNLWTE